MTVTDAARRMSALLLDKSTWDPRLNHEYKTADHARRSLVRFYGVDTESHSMSPMDGCWIAKHEKSKSKACALTFIIKSR